MSVETRLAEKEEWRRPEDETRIADRISIPELVATFRQSEADIMASFASINAAVGRLGGGRGRSISVFEGGMIIGPRSSGAIQGRC